MKRITLSVPRVVLFTAAAYAVIRGVMAATSAFPEAHGFNEALYSAVAQAYADDPWVPRYHGAGFHDTPPLLTYLMALAQLVLGPTELAARLPSILATASAIIATWLLGRRIYGEHAGRRAAVLLAVMPWVMVWGGRGQTDALLMAAGVWFLACLANLDRPWSRPALAASLALGLLAKQPMLLFLPALWPLRHEWRSWRRPVIVGLAVPAAWWILQLALEPAEVLGSVSFHAVDRAAPFVNLPRTIIMGLLIGSGGLILIAPRKWSPILGLPLAAWLLFVLVNTLFAHQYYTLPMMPLIAVHAGRFIVPKGPNVSASPWVYFAAAILVAVALAGAMLAQHGDLGDNRIRDLSTAVPPGVDIYAPSHIAPIVEWYTGAPVPGYQTFPSQGYVYSTHPLAGCHVVAEETYMGKPMWLADCTEDVD